MSLSKKDQLTLEDIKLRKKDELNKRCRKWKKNTKDFLKR